MQIKLLEDEDFTQQIITSKPEEPQYLNQFLNLMNPKEIKQVNWMSSGKIKNYPLFCSSNGKYIVLAEMMIYDHLNVWIINTHQNKLVKNFANYQDDYDQISVVHITSDSKYLVIGGDRHTWVYTLENGQVKFSIYKPSNQDEQTTISDFNNLLYICYQEQYRIIKQDYDQYEQYASDSDKVYYNKKQNWAQNYDSDSDQGYNLNYLQNYDQDYYNDENSDQEFKKVGQNKNKYLYYYKNEYEWNSQQSDSYINIYSKVTIVNLNNGEVLYKIDLFCYRKYWITENNEFFFLTQVIPLTYNTFYSYGRISQNNKWKNQDFLPGFLRKKENGRILQKTPKYHSIASCLGISSELDGYQINLFSLQKNKLMKKIYPNHNGLDFNQKIGPEMVLQESNIIIQFRYHNSFHLIQKILVLSQHQNAQEFSNICWSNKNQAYQVLEQENLVRFYEY